MKAEVLRMKSAIVLIADGSEEVEALSPVDYLRRAGVDVSIVSVGTASRTVTLSRKVSVNADITLEAYLSAASGSLPDAIIVPGGMPGTTNIADSRSAVALAEEMHKAGKLVCAICAAPAFVLSKTSALDCKILGIYGNFFSVDFSKAGNDTIVGNILFVHAETCAVVAGGRIDLKK
jgi:4-methyl-5(b-hydroxyethyl)-thiazole monophosphate biosynthesis